jgi:hypothetical protein
VEAESLDAQAAGKRDKLCDRRQGSVERRVEARDVGEARSRRRDRLDGSDRLRQVIGRELFQTAQVVEHLGRDTYRRCIVRAAVHDPVSHRIESAACFLSDEIEELRERVAVRPGGSPVGRRRVPGPGDLEAAAGQPESAGRPAEKQPLALAHCVHPELRARGARVDRQHPQVSSVALAGRFTR